jgi:hypothetical protein
MNFKNIIILSLLAIGITAYSSPAQAFTVNGRLGEWGVTPGLYGASDWTPNSGILSEVEDQKGNIGAYLNPGYGGQLFDAEAMYAMYDNTNFYFAIVTGKSPRLENGYRPGDIAFDFGSNGSFEYGIQTTGEGTGSLYSVNTWKHGLWNLTDPTEMDSVGQVMGTGSLVYNNTFYGTSAKGSHYVIEGYIPLDSFGDDWGYGKQFTMSWTQTCGNDVIRLNVTPTPEPATMALFGIGLAGLGALRRRQFKA